MVEIKVRNGEQRAYTVPEAVLEISNSLDKHNKLLEEQNEILKKIHDAIVMLRGE